MKLSMQNSDVNTSPELEEIKTVKKSFKNLIGLVSLIVVLQLYFRSIRIANPGYITKWNTAVFVLINLVLFVSAGFNIYKILHQMLKKESFYPPDWTWVE